jgi:hypothetical protein
MRYWLLTTFLTTIIIIMLFYFLRIDSEQHVMTFPNWKKSYDLTKGVIESDGHNAYVEIFLNHKAIDAYVEVKPMFPVGSKVFKPLYSDPEGKYFARLVIMVKMQEGYDSAHGDWWYGVYDESGMEMAYEGRIPECINCHIVAKETDYLFSRSVMKKLNGIDTNEYEEYEPDGEEY